MVTPGWTPTATGPACMTAQLADSVTTAPVFASPTVGDQQNASTVTCCDVVCPFSSLQNLGVQSCSQHYCSVLDKLYVSKYMPTKLTTLAEDFRVLHQSLQAKPGVMYPIRLLSFYSTHFAILLPTRRSTYTNIGILFYLTNILLHSSEPLQRVCVSRQLTTARFT